MNDLTITYIKNSIATTVACMDYELRTSATVENINMFSEEIATKTTLLNKYIAGEELDIVEKIRLDSIIAVATKEVV